MIEIGNHRAASKHDPFQSQQIDISAASCVHPLDSDETIARFDKVRNWFHQSVTAQYQSRRDMAKDHAYYDGEQWSKEDKEMLEGPERGQAALVFNKIKPTVDWILGTERKSRVETLVLARNKDKSSSAEAKTKLLKYIDDVNMSAYHRSQAFAEATISGLSWLETGVCGDSQEEPLYSRHESWRNCWYDHLAQELNYKDGRFFFRSKWVDLDIAQAMYPDRRFELESEAQHTLKVYPFNAEDADVYGAGTYDEITGRSTYADGGPFIEEVTSTANRRLRVRLVEAWYKETTATKICHCPDTPLHGSVINQNDKHQQFAVEQGIASIVDAIKPIVRVMVYCGKTVLHDSVSPYRHNRIPFIPVWCYRKGKDNTPYGVVRNIIDPQDDLNKRHSKLLHLLNSNKVAVDSNASDNWQQFYDEMQKPDGVVKLTPGARFMPQDNLRATNEQMSLIGQDAQFIQDVSGVTDENLGRNTNVDSGIGIRRKQAQGMISTSVIFDNLNMAMQTEGEIKLSLIEQFYDTPKIVRLLNDKNAASYMSINEVGGDNITDDRADFIVTQQDYRDTIRQSMFEMMSEFSARLDPQVSLSILDLVVDMSDMPGREQLVQRIRKINGQSDPESAVTPEQEQEAQIKEQQVQLEAQNQKDIQQKMAELELRAKEVATELDAAKLEKMKAEAVVKSVEALYASMQAAQTAATIPGVVPIADEIAKSAGFVDKNQSPIFTEPVAIQPETQTPVNTSPMYPANPVSAGEGLLHGIETQRNDGTTPPQGEL